MLSVKNTVIFTRANDVGLRLVNANGQYTRKARFVQAVPQDYE